MNRMRAFEGINTYSSWKLLDIFGETVKGMLGKKDLRELERYAAGSLFCLYKKLIEKVEKWLKPLLNWEYSVRAV